MQASRGAAAPRSILQRLRSLEFHTVRRILFWWIRPTILGCDRDGLGLDDSDAVCYVLPFRSLADLLVVDKACEDAGLPRPYLPMRDDIEQRSFFFLGRPEGRFFGRTSRRRQSERMQRLFDHQAGRDIVIKALPVSLFWGHQPAREKSLFKLLLSDNWAVTSRFKKFLAIVFHPRHILVQFGEAISLRELTAEQDDRELRIRKLLRILRVHFDRQKQAILGPDLSHRRTLINEIMSSEPVRGAIWKEATSSGADVASVEKKALGYANEIASDQSYRIIRFFHVLLTWLWHKLYDGIDVHNIEQVKSLARSHEIVYTPCHRSHIDYLLLSYVLYHNGLTPPHIAAGKNLNLPVAGPLLRRAGAFFMRRSFQGDTLYKAVFDEYLHLMFVRGYSVEYFIEGGRSRTGRTLTPRTGMLSMTMRSFQRDASRPMALMPVYFSYERIIEAPTYMTELAGKDKKEESILDIFKIFGVFRNSFGKVAVSFGEPVIMSEFLDRTLPGWTNPEAVNGAAFSGTCTALSRQLATNINAAAVVNPVNLVATALLGTPRQTMEASRLVGQLEMLREVVARAPGPGHPVVTELSPEEMITEAENVAGIVRIEQPFGAMIQASSDVAVLLTYYRNSTAHLFAMPSLIARIVRKEQQTNIGTVVKSATLLYPFLENEFFLPWSTGEIPALCVSLAQSLQSIDLLQFDGETISAPEPTSAHFACLSDLAEVIQPTLERFLIVATLLHEQTDGTIREIETNAAGVGRQLSAIYGINSPEFFERSLFSTFIATLRAEGIIATRDGHIEVKQDFERLQKVIAATLDPDVRYNVLQSVSSLVTH